MFDGNADTVAMCQGETFFQAYKRYYMEFRQSLHAHKGPTFILAKLFLRLPANVVEAAKLASLDPEYAGHDPEGFCERIDNLLLILRPSPALTSFTYD